MNFLIVEQEKSKVSKGILLDKVIVPGWHFRKSTPERGMKCWKQGVWVRTGRQEGVGKVTGKEKRAPRKSQ